MTSATPITIISTDIVAVAVARASRCSGMDGVA
jgi:hypothetical protein